MRTRPILPLILIAACTSTPAPVTPPAPARPAQPAPTAERGLASRPAPPLPAIPLVDGPLVIKTAYPEPNQSIPVRDSNFIFGTVGSGRATLMINGAQVKVAPNGTFMAFLPVPPPSAPRYELVATNGAANARLTVPVRVPAPRVELPTEGRLVVDSGSVSPRGASNLVLRDSEPVRVSVRAPINANAFVLTPTQQRLPLANVGGNTFATDVTYADLVAGSTLYVTRGGDTTRFALSRPTPGTTRGRIVMLGDSLAQRDTDATVIGRDVPAGTYKWMFVPGTIVEQTGRSGDNVRVRLDSQLEVWVDAPSVKPLPAGFPMPRRTVGAMAVVPSAEWVDVVMPVSSVPPYLIEQNLRSISITLYGTSATPETIKFFQNDSLVRMINWIPVASDRIRLDLELTQAPYGYLAFYQPGRGFVLRLRRAPKINVARPLEGLTLVVDPGHPPGGAVGPTGFTEAEGALAVGLKLRDLLQQRGAKVVMTRTDMRPVDLHERSVIARRANAHALISIHYNAFGDGTNPFTSAGTSTLFFHPQSEPMARLIQIGMMREIGQRDIGVHYQNIAIGRTMWMPSTISEGLFLMFPEQEWSARTEEGQLRYARGVADGVEAYFRSLGQR